MLWNCEETVGDGIMRYEEESPQERRKKSVRRRMFVAVSQRLRHTVKADGSCREGQGGCGNHNAWQDVAGTAMQSERNRKARRGRRGERARPGGVLMTRLQQKRDGEPTQAPTLPGSAQGAQCCKREPTEERRMWVYKRGHIRGGGNNTRRETRYQRGEWV